jgi:hypothetical protein
MDEFERRAIGVLESDTGNLLSNAGQSQRANWTNFSDVNVERKRREEKLSVEDLARVTASPETERPP